MSLTGDYARAAGQLYEAVRPTCAHAFPPEAADRLAAVEVIRVQLVAAYLDGRTAEVLGLADPWPAGTPFPGPSLLTPPNGGRP